MALALGLLALLAALGLTLALALWRARQPLDLAQAAARLTAKVDAARRRPQAAGTGLWISAPRLGLDAGFGADLEGPPFAFHAASVGKLFTATLIARQIEAGALDWHTPVAPHLPPGTLDGLCVVDGVDHQAAVTVEQLLGHTAGLADYFADPGSAPPIVDQIVAHPERRWTPAELLAHSRDHQRPVGPPGARFHYSDTGYIVLGLLLEQRHGAPFEHILQTELFDPLGMTRSHLVWRGAPRDPAARTLRPVYLKGAERSTAPALTADWAGGGVATTAPDLIRFHRALHRGALIRPETLAHLSQPRHRFHRGIHYGLGVMTLRFREFFPTLGGLPPATGHMGVIGCQLFAWPDEDIHVVVSMGADRSMVASVRLLIDALATVQRLRPPGPAPEPPRA